MPAIEMDPLYLEQFQSDIKNPLTSSITTINQRGNNTQLDVQQYLCGECGKGYKSMRNLTRHQSYECEGRPRFRCKICDDHHNQMGLAGWMIKQNEDYGIPPHSFLQMVQTINYNDKKDSRKRNMKNTTVICEQCGKTFSRLDSLRRHEKNYCKAKGDQFNCEYCENVKVAGNLTEDNHHHHHHHRHHHHQHHHHDEDPEICDMQFHGQLTMNYLLCDSSILNPVEPSIVQSRTNNSTSASTSTSNSTTKSCQQFRCDGCGRTYTRVDSLKRHQQKCQDLLALLQDSQDNLERLQQEYSCNQCGKRYKRLDTLRRHQRLVCADRDSVHSVIKTDKTGTS
ncbi:PREDICTED: histone-lysine N-methyltransferase PRDM9-like [Polistes dominula]|uniref:Histone-lysine N-methyltransferase PRDM9-like n=1 Tax=Polistes dominula TaxID=743375 RepID=A0ABM1IEF8_POLDO|nr:PREDICTED: histone-lysine N-methyltransferase PRDM9-like [Polistes dominula]